MKKYIIVIITILCLSLTIASFIYESNAVGEILTNAESYRQIGTEDNDGLKKIGNVIVGVVRAVGESIAVIILLIIGIKYILGSVEERAEYKKSMWPYIIGAGLIFAGAAFTDIIYRAFQ